MSIAQYDLHKIYLKMYAKNLVVLLLLYKFYNLNITFRINIKILQKNIRACLSYVWKIFLSIYFNSI